VDTGATVTNVDMAETDRWLTTTRAVSIVPNTKIEEVGPVDLKPGSRCKSVADATEVMVVRAPAQPVDLRCGGHPMVPFGAEQPPVAAADAGYLSGTALGKRYADDASGLELLCTKAGAGSLAIGDAPLLQKDAKALPSSD
jgi:hypothetical protein